jgi:hypothetical protein
MKCPATSELLYQEARGRPFIANSAAEQWGMEEMEALEGDETVSTRRDSRIKRRRKIHNRPAFLSSMPGTPATGTGATVSFKLMRQGPDLERRQCAPTTQLQRLRRRPSQEKAQRGQDRGTTLVISRLDSGVP